ncbi:uncharacterized protein LOC34622930 [Cyclospora cayetanensis]|uniref:Uncharacterized protein LOC34622930 n=1 Tax=Cyclospora cayetanensis TaxID=88456 RepID=A0A6P6RU39_9EIME|nr:uncharacterized protein LOC34622930 [Cyclospora cayetanensis]
MVQRIEAVILECLSDLSVSGFSPAAIDAALNTVEFRRREFPRGPTLPRGLMFTRLMAADMNYHRDPLLSIQFEKALGHIKKALNKGERVFEKLITQSDLLKASTTKAAEREAAERDALQAARATMGSEELMAIAQTQKALQEKQVLPETFDNRHAWLKKLETRAAWGPEALVFEGLVLWLYFCLVFIARSILHAKITCFAQACLYPCLGCYAALLLLCLLYGLFLQEAEKIPIHVDSVGSVPLVTHDLPTSGLVYIDVALSLDALTLEEIQYLPLLGSMLTEAGTEQLPPEDLLPLIGQHTGGISASFAATPVPSVPYTVPEPVQAKGFLFLSGKLQAGHTCGAYLHRPGWVAYYGGAAA